ncbi:MAG: bifunctional oligoribonuclease/PAP phosphatase NrnA [bacterium]
MLLLTHHNPDGDGLSSLCAMIEYLNTLNKKYFAYCDNQPPKTFDFIKNISQINYKTPTAEQIQNETNQPLNFSAHDLILIFDCGSLSRTKLNQAILSRSDKQLIIEFDHHPKVDDFSDLEIRDTDSAATAEIIYNFFKVNNLEINKNTAKALLTGLITDTANFLYPSATNLTIDAASDLITKGAHLSELTDRTLRNKSLDSMKLWGKIMSSLQINPQYKIAFAVLAAEDFKLYKVEKEELEGISGFLSNLKDVNALVFIREEGDGIIRGSLRTSHSNIDVSKLAHLLGGGGHPKASGFSINGKLIKINDHWQIT